MLLEARVTENYLVGQNEDDDFIVLRAGAKVKGAARVDLAEQRRRFLNALVTDAWYQYITSSYVIEHRFRPIEGQYKGRAIQLEENKLTGVGTWEYSPSTGVLRYAYEEYVGGAVIGRTLALINQEGEQVFFGRKPNGADRTFTLSDVRVHKVDETRPVELADLLSGQFQHDDYLYSFEFNSDGRRGFIHKWRSIPFVVAAHEISSEEVIDDTETIYSVEDFVLFEDNGILKRDATASRLRPKTEAEAHADVDAMEEKIQKLTQNRLVLRITGHKGEVTTVALPFGSMGDIAGIAIVKE